MELIYNSPNTTEHEITKWSLWTKRYRLALEMVSPGKCRMQALSSRRHIWILHQCTILNSWRPPSYSCDLYLGLKRGCRAPAHQGQADDMSYCHSPFCLVTPHDLVLLKPAAKNSPLLYLVQPYTTCQYRQFRHPFLHCDLCNLQVSVALTHESIQASTSTSQALNKLCTYIFYAFCAHWVRSAWYWPHFGLFICGRDLVSMHVTKNTIESKSPQNYSRW